MHHGLVAVLVVVHQLISILWYSPYWLGVKWFSKTGLRLSEVPTYQSFAFYWPFILSIFASIALCYLMAYLLRGLQIGSIALQFACIVWLGFVFLSMLTHHQFAQHPLSLTFIDSGRDLLLIVITSITRTFFSSRSETSV